MRLGDRPAAVAAFEQAMLEPMATTRRGGPLVLALTPPAGAESHDPSPCEQLATTRRRSSRTPCWACTTQPRWRTFAERSPRVCRRTGFRVAGGESGVCRLGLFEEAGQLVQAACVDAVPPAERSFLPLYYLAWFAAQRGDAPAARQWLKQAAGRTRIACSPRGPRKSTILRYAVKENPATPRPICNSAACWPTWAASRKPSAAWQQAAELRRPSQSIAWRNLGLRRRHEERSARGRRRCYRKAIAARPSDQTLYRDLAEILIAAEPPARGVQLLETMPLDGLRRAEITVMLAQAYVAEQRYEDCLKLLESTPYFVNWEGQDITWRLFNRAHVERGRQRLEQGDAAGALADFEAALTYPANLNVGRSNKPEEAPPNTGGAEPWPLDRPQEARAAWQAGAAGVDAPGLASRVSPEMPGGAGRQMNPFLPHL